MIISFKETMGNEQKVTLTISSRMGIQRLRHSNGLK